MKEKANLTLGVGTLPFSAEFKSITPGRVCRAVGWGKTNVNEPASDTLREVKMRILDPQNCNHFPDFHDKLQLCVGKKMRNVYKVILLLVFFENHCWEPEGEKEAGQKIVSYSQCLGIRE